MTDKTLDEWLRSWNHQETEITPKRTKRKVPRGWLAILVLLFVAGGAVGLVALFTHNFPATPSGTTPVLSTSCAAPASLAVNNPSSMTIGTAGTVLYECGVPPSPTSEAFSVTLTGSATPAFTLPTNAGTVGLSILAHSATATTCSPGTSLTSGTAVSFTLGQLWDYCLSYTSYPAAGISSFTLIWSQ